MMRQAKLGFTETSFRRSGAARSTHRWISVSTATLLRVCVRAAGWCEHRACGTGFTSRRGGTHRRRRRHTHRCRRPGPCQSRGGGGRACAPPEVSPWSTARWRMKPAFRRLRRSGPRSARPRCCYGFAASSVPAGKLPPRSRAIASLQPDRHRPAGDGEAERASEAAAGPGSCAALRSELGGERVTACLSRR